MREKRLMKAKTTKTKVFPRKKERKKKRRKQKH